ncbi:MAG: four-carbon acid sugar kinase family protein [Methylococcales bacterium]|jgi:uncharacterized protein YgbK (DUF1537 family)|nr:four-carbon acid sugar kinase family protein [Methylococcales bacterium]MBT7408160.1 four-carbon acid sugar kinase family protein [Methylococcales bacterium]
MSKTKIIVLDDDPTGSQTVHSCLLLTRWDVETLKQGLIDTAPLFFVLTNTRGMSATDAANLTREVCVNVREALKQLANNGQPINPILVSRSDSTLRGHYPVETDIIAEELGPFDAHFMVPAFFEGGRVTIESVHYLLIDDQLVPVHETEFANDSVFAYSHSYLPDYVEEKTSGHIISSDVECFNLQNVRGDSLSRLLSLKSNQCCVVDGEVQADLDHFCGQLMQAAREGKRFLFRSAASLLTALAQLPEQPVASEKMREYVRGEEAGAVIVGSHVAKTTNQLNHLLRQPGVYGIEIDVEKIIEYRDELLTKTMASVEDCHAKKQTPVIYTSRTELQFEDQQARLAFGEDVSAFLMDIVRKLPVTTGFLISKGGITSNDVLSDGLRLPTSRVVGQILAGCSVVRCPQNHSRFPQMPVVIFPGNVGDDQAMATVYQRLRPMNG